MPLPRRAHLRGPGAGDHRRAAQSEVEALKEQVAKERETARAQPEQRASRGRPPYRPRAKPTSPLRPAGEMETQLQDVLSLWENAATEAKSESAAEVAELRKQARPAHTHSTCAFLLIPASLLPVRAQVEQLQEKLTAQESTSRASEATMRSEMEQIMRLWEEAQLSSAAEVQSLQDRILELRSRERDQHAKVKEYESRSDSF
jgi:hypothetical protein